MRTCDYLTILEDLSGETWYEDLSNVELEALGIQMGTYAYWDEDFESMNERLYA